MEIKQISWEDVFERLSHFDHSHYKIYGVPNGGMIAAGLLQHAQVVVKPEMANLILDDILDSGATKSFYSSNYQAVFQTLYDKKDFPGQWLVFPWEAQHPSGPMTVESNITRILQYIGEDVTRDGLINTPSRVVKSFAELYSGYHKKEEDIFTVFDNDEKYDQMVIAKDIDFYSMCEHHMLPFFGKAHIAYIPDTSKIVDKVVGISKLPRLLEIHARRLQNQERIAASVTKSLMHHLNPLGAACVLEARHMCMCSRGVNKKSKMITSSLRGEFLDNPIVRAEFMNLIK